MQITIVQSEIEDAIRQHINNQINVKDGMRIDIDLKATRGDDGYTAVIDIVPETAAKRVAVEDTTGSTGTGDSKGVVAPAPAKAAATTTATPTRRTTAKEVTAAPAPVAAPAAETVAEAAPAAAETVEAAPVAQDTTEAAPAADEAPVTPRRSLFGSLTPPVNS
jgi:hypothetical protein